MRWLSSVGNAFSGSVLLGFASRRGLGAGRLLAPRVGDGGREVGRERAGVPGSDC